MVFLVVSNLQSMCLLKEGFASIFSCDGMSLILSVLLLLTVAIIVVFEVFIQKTIIQDVLSDTVF